MSGLFDGRVRAPAKINLALHVTGRRDDGYHLLDSLVVFAPDVADDLLIETVEADMLAVDGPYAEGVPLDRRNIVLQALDLAREEAGRNGFEIPPLACRLTKNLPHAAGIGGGSADAGALLRHLGNAAPGLRDRLQARCNELGADVPMCLNGRSSIASGIGEELTPAALAFRPIMVLVNPGRPVATPAIFRALTERNNSPLPPVPSGGFGSQEALIDWLQATRNDLQGAASKIEPSIAAALDALFENEASFTRMSGSGATVFGLFADTAKAETAVREIARVAPDWWVRLA